MRLRLPVCGCSERVSFVNCRGWVCNLFPFCPSSSWTCFFFLSCLSWPLSCPGRLRAFPPSPRKAQECPKTNLSGSLCQSLSLFVAFTLSFSLSLSLTLYCSLSVSLSLSLFVSVSFSHALSCVFLYLLSPQHFACAFPG